MSKRLLISDVMSDTLYEILHEIKYRVFNAFGISKLKYGGNNETLDSLCQGGGHYFFVLKPYVYIMFDDIGHKYFPINFHRHYQQRGMEDT